MSQPNVNIGCVKNLFVRQMHFANAGDSEQGHAHQFDHMTLLARGRLSVCINDEVTEFTAPQMIYIKAGIQHELTALSDGAVAYCVHALRDESGEIIDASMVPKSRELHDFIQRLVPG
jgi:quercetin dioxygenase-like cupin family protein